MTQISLQEVRDLAYRALIAHRTSDANATSVAASIQTAEADGLRSHGLMRLPTYCAHAKIGKVDGHAVPTVERPKPGLIRADAKTGFAHPAIELGLAELVAAARETGIGGLAVFNSYNCGVVGHHAERLARNGFIALAFVNAPRAIAPWGGTRALYGTNPIAFACPRRSGEPLVIDQSSSVVARGEIMLHASQNKPIPSDWGVDAAGKSTTDAKAVLDGGSLLPAGGYKGAGLALIVEIMAAALAGARFGFEASSFADNEGGPPRTGQFFLAIDAAAFNCDFTSRVEELFQEVGAQQGARLPGERRLKTRAETPSAGVSVADDKYAELKGLAGA